MRKCNIFQQSAQRLRGDFRVAGGRKASFVVASSDAIFMLLRAPYKRGLAIPKSGGLEAATRLSF